ncbi:hypothetical protein MACJ_003842 [Theileria orientalis]|uniref:Uncharacterized protein n=1 Tax=Theileria orientalis TaxID=68886 RepID=A0A976XJC8_THEOR|nr:hypothetical protein MACJ_003842 [Theileria orientalis]
MSDQIDFYDNEESEVKWWEEPEDSEEPVPDYSWSPPKVVDLVRNVHINRTTHIKAPFHHRRYPYEFKTEEYFKYKADADDKLNDTEKPAKEGAKSEKDGSDVPKMNLELNPVKREDPTYRKFFKNKSLRQRIYDGEVFFYDDYLEYNIAKDYCRLFRRPFDIPRQDWGGQNFHFGKKLPDRRLVEEQVEILKRDSMRSMAKEEVNEMSETEALIMSSKYLDDFKRKELLKGEIPSLFENNSSVTKQRPRRERWVSYHNLKNYGLMIDSVTKCPLIHVQLRSAFQMGWNPHPKSSILDQSEAHTNGKTVDPYLVSEEQMEKVRAALSEKKKVVEEPLPDITKLFKSKNYGINENCYTIGGGRYRV